MMAGKAGEAILEGQEGLGVPGEVGRPFRRAVRGR